MERALTQINEVLQRSESFQQKYGDPGRLSKTGYGLFIFGSAVNGLGSKSSDLDLTFIFSNPSQAIDHDVILKDIRRCIKKYQTNHQFEFDPPFLIKAGWLMRGKDKANQLDVDIMINKNLEVYNSALLLQYTKLDNRFGKVVLYLKRWSNKYFDNKMRLNNYSLYLMLIAYMQMEGLLPNLQALAGCNTVLQNVTHQQKLKSQCMEI